jgi:signal transduction histidine kinase
MRQANWLLASVAVAVLMASLAVLGWLRSQMIDDMRRDLREMALSLSPEALLHGPRGDSLLWFATAEELVGRGRRSPYIDDAVLSLRRDGGREFFVVPFTFATDHAGKASEALADYRAFPLGGENDPFGTLYLRLDDRLIGRVTWAIAATALAILLILAALLARLWSQESSLTRTVIELNERRRELIRLERLALAGELSAGLLHDLRKPVLNIRLSLDEMEEALGDFGPAAAPLRDLRAHAALFFEILEGTQIERFVRSDRVGEEYVDIGPLLDASFNLVRYEQRGVTVERTDPADLPPIFGHPFRLIQLFSNLILNAYQALKGRGAIRVDAHAEPGAVVVRLTDNGPGIPSEALERIFEPFFTSKPEGEGTGLGLSICRMIVDDLGGDLRVESRPGGPTSFIVRLPCEQNAAGRRSADKEGLR